MKITKLFGIAAAALIAAGCGRSSAKPDDTQARDLQLTTTAGQLGQPAYASAEELGYQPVPASYNTTSRPTGSAARTAARPAQRTSGTVYRAPRKVTHSRRDAVIGAAAGAVTGAVIGRNVKGAIIGAGVGGVLGAVVGATVDVSHQ